MIPDKKWWFRIAAASATAALAVTALACGSNDDDKTPAATAGTGDKTSVATSSTGGKTAVATKDSGTAADVTDVEDTIKQAFDDWNAKDLEKFTAHFTDAGLVNSFGEEGAAAADVKADLANFIGSGLISDPTFNETTVDGTTATSDVQYAFARSLDHSKFTLTQVGDEWKFNEEEHLTVAIPSGYTTVHIDLNEFAFALDTAEITDATGKIALEGSNVGKQQHEINLLRIPADAVLADLIAAEGGDFPNVEIIGGVGPIEPGKGDNLVFAEALEPGRYILLCGLPDTSEGSDGAPHASKGMVKEFVIE
jgi:hypothetical protein